MSAANPAPNSVEIFVRDAGGDTFCHSFACLNLEARMMKHARWWMRQQRRHIGFDGKPLSICRPLTLHVERYFDPSAT
jgi:hypothetical protein